MQYCTIRLYVRQMATAIGGKDGASVSRPAGGAFAAEPTQHDCSDQVHEYYELHREAKRPAQILYLDKLHEIVNRGIDPASALR